MTLAQDTNEWKELAKALSMVDYYQHTIWNENPVARCASLLQSRGAAGAGADALRYGAPEIAIFDVAVMHILTATAWTSFRQSSNLGRHAFPPKTTTMR